MGHSGDLTSPLKEILSSKNYIAALALWQGSLSKELMIADHHYEHPGDGLFGITVIMMSVRRKHFCGVVTSMGICDR